MINQKALFQFLAGQPADVLLGMLKNAYEVMDDDQRAEVIGSLAQQIPPTMQTVEVDPDEVLEEIEDFRAASLAGNHYEPFAINSKNWRHIPDGTREWFDDLGDLLADCVQLTRQGQHGAAVECFAILWALILQMENGAKIVFGDEIGGWMIPGDKKQHLRAYLESLAATATPEAFTQAVTPLLVRDSHQSFSGQVYQSAADFAGPEQRAQMAAEIARLKIRTG